MFVFTFGYKYNAMVQASHITRFTSYHLFFFKTDKNCYLNPLKRISDEDEDDFFPDEEYFPKRPSGAPLHTLSKLYDVPVGVVPPPYFEAEYCLFCGRQRVAVARYRMICLVLLKKQPATSYTHA